MSKRPSKWTMDFFKIMHFNQMQALIRLAATLVAIVLTVIGLSVIGTVNTLAKIKALFNNRLELAKFLKERLYPLSDSQFGKQHEWL